MHAVVFFNDTATTEIYTLSLHDALPIYVVPFPALLGPEPVAYADSHALVLPSSPGRSDVRTEDAVRLDRKSTRLNSSHANISYAVFCLKKKISPSPSSSLLPSPFYVAVH